MRLSDLNPDDVEIVKPSSQPLKLSQLSPTDIEVHQPEEPKLEVGQGEAALRGVGQGLSLGFSDELIAGGKALVNPDEQDFWDRYAKYKAEQQARENAAAEQNPATYYGTELASGLLLPVGALGTAAKGATVGQKAIQAAKVGAAIGGVTGIGKSEPILDTGKTLESGLHGATVGGVVGGALSGLGHGTMSLLNKFGKGSSVIAKPARAMELGISENTDVMRKAAPGERNLLGYTVNKGELLDFQKLNNELYNKIEQLGLDINSRTVKTANKMNQLVAEADKQGIPVDNKQMLSLLNELEDSLDLIKNPNSRGEVADIVKFGKDSILGAESKSTKVGFKPGKMVEPTETKFIPEGEVPRVPSSMEQLESDAAKMRATKGIYEPGTTYAPQETVDPVTGKKFQQVVKSANTAETGSANAGVKKGDVFPLTGAGDVDDSILGKVQDEVFKRNMASEQAQLPVEYYIDEVGDTLVIKSRNKVRGVGKVLEPTEAIPEYTKGKMGEVKVPGEYQELIPTKETVISRPNKPMTFKELQQMEQEVGKQSFEGAQKTPFGQQAIKQLDKVTTETLDQAIPEYAGAREEFHQFKEAFNALGIPKNMEILINAGPTLADGTQEKILNPEIVKKVAQSLTFGNEVGLDTSGKLKNLQIALNYLKAAGVENIDETVAQLQALGERYNLGKTAAEASTLPINPATGTFAGGLKTISGAANIAGYGGAPAIRGAAKIASRLATQHGNEVIESKPTEQKLSLSRDIYNMSPEQYTQVSNVLKQDPGTAYIGNAIDKAMSSGDRMKRDQAMFLIKGNAKAKQLLGME